MITACRKLNLFWLLCVAGSWLLLCGCASEMSRTTQTTQLPDGTTINFTIKNGKPAPAENEWAKMITAAIVIRTEKEGPQFKWQFGFRFKTPDIQSLTIIDVTSSRPVILFEQKGGIIIDPKGNFFDGQKVSWKSPGLSWLFEPIATKKVFKVVLQNSAGEQKILYQPAVYTAAENRALTDVVERAQHRQFGGKE